MKRKHAAEIIAWANGAEIQRELSVGRWVYDPYPNWLDDYNFRVKPEPRMDVVRDASVFTNGDIEAGVFSHPMVAGGFSHPMVAGFIRYTIDGETRKLKSAEVIE